MRYVQLRAFHNVCLTGGFSKAAKSLHLSQPAVSEQIRKLEEEYDALLLHRHGKQIVPTDIGRELLEITHRFFETETQARELLSSRRDRLDGQLRIIVDSPIHLIPALSRYSSKHPEVKISFSSGNSEQVLSKLASYDADIGVMGAAIDNTDFACFHLNTSPLIAFVHQTHKLAKRRTISLADLCKHTVIIRETGSRTRSSLEHLLKTNKLTLQHSIEAAGREAVKELVQGGIGVGIVSQAELGNDPALIPLKLKGCTTSMSESLVCLQTRLHTRTIASFIESTVESIVAHPNSN